jgi:hypothetical protein
MYYYVYFSNLGVPATDLSPTWRSLYQAESRQNLVSDPSVSPGPLIEEIGDGWYRFDVTLGDEYWFSKTQDLVGTIDGGNSLANADRYKPASITLRGLALARLIHKNIQNKNTADIEIYKTDGVTKDFDIDITETSATITREPI